MKADLVLLAMGFVHPVHEGMIKSLGLELDPRGNVKADTRGLPELEPEGVRRRRHAARPVAGGVGDPRRPPGRARGRQVPDGIDDAAALSCGADRLELPRQRARQRAEAADRRRRPRLIATVGAAAQLARARRRGIRCAGWLARVVLRPSGASAFGRAPRPGAGATATGAVSPAAGSRIRIVDDAAARPG